MYMVSMLFQFAVGIVAASKSFIPSDLSRGKILAKHLQGMIDSDGFLAVGTSVVPPAVAHVLGYFPSTPRVVFDEKGVSRQRWLSMNEAPMPRPTAILFLVGEERNLLMRLGKIIAMLRDSTSWNIYAPMAVEAPTLSPMELVFAHFDVSALLGLRWDGSEYRPRNITLDDGPGMYILMTACPPELHNPEPKPFLPNDPDQLLAQVLIQKVHRLQEMECLEPYSIGMSLFFDNGTISPAVQDFFDGKIIMAATGSLQDYYPIVTYLQPHVQDDYCLQVRRSDFIPFLEGVVLIFTSSTWSALGGCLFAFTVVETALTFRQRIKDSHITIMFALVDSFFSTIRTCVTGCFSNKNYKSSHWEAARVRTLRLMLSLLSLVMTNAFGGSLTGHLSRPRDAHNLDTLAEVDAAVKNVHVLPIYIKRFEALDNDDEVKRLTSKFVPTFFFGSEIELRLRMVRGDPLAMLSPRWSFRKMSKLPMLSRNGHSMLHQTRQCALSPAFKGMMLRRGHPLEVRLNKLILQILQAGLYEKFEQQALMNVHTFHNSSVQRVGAPPLPYQPYVLAFRHLRGGFKGLMMALATSIVLFGAECLQGRRRRRDGNIVQHPRK